MPPNRLDTLIERLHRLAPLFGIRRFDFHLSIEERDRLIALSLLPATAVVLVIVAFLSTELGPHSGRLNLTVDWSGRVLSAAYYGSQALTLAATASVFFAALGRVTRSIGSWAAVAACALAVVSFASAAFVFFVALDSSDIFGGVVRYNARVWEQLAYVTGHLAIGYAFLAYRGVSAPAPRRSYGRRR